MSRSDNNFYSYESKHNILCFVLVFSELQAGVYEGFVHLDELSILLRRRYDPNRFSSFHLNE